MKKSEESFEHKVARNLKRLRHVAGLTQGELAECIGIARNTLARYENERQMMDLEMASRIVSGLGVTLNDLVR